MKDIKTRNCLDVVSNCQAAALKMNNFMVPMMPNYFVTHCSLRLRDKKIKKNRKIQLQEIFAQLNISGNVSQAPFLSCF